MTASTCPNCNRPRFHGATGYVGPMCLCVWQVPPTPRPDLTPVITEDTIRRIVREEIERALKEAKDV